MQSCVPGPTLEGIPGRFRRELQVTDIDAEAGSDAGPDRDHDHLVRCNSRHAEAADEVGRAVDAHETLIECVREGHVVDQHHGAGAVAAHVEPERRTLPEYLALARIAGEELALAVAQSAEEGPGGFLA